MPSIARALVVAARRVVGAGEHDRHRRVLGLADRVAVDSAGGRCRASAASQVALEPRHQHLRLGIAEARVELEHARPVGGEHQPGEQAADERGAAPRELVEHRLVDAVHELGGVREPRHRRVRAHAAGVRALRRRRARA